MDGAGRMLDRTDQEIGKVDVGEDGDEAGVSVNFLDGTGRESGVPISAGAVPNGNRLRWRLIRLARSGCRARAAATR